MKSFLKKYRLILALTLYALLIAGGIYFVIRPLLGEVKANANKIQRVVLDEENKKKRLAELPKLQSQFEMVKREEDKITSLLEEAKAVELIEQMEKLAGETGNKITIEVQNNSKRKAPAGKKEEKKEGEEKEKDIRSDLPQDNYLEIKIRLEGDYNNLVNFLEKMESASFYSDVISLEIVKNETGSVSYVSRPNPFSGSTLSSEEKALVPEKEIKKEPELTSTVGAVFYLKEEKK